MIKKEELRIGNFVKFKHIEGTLVEFASHDNVLIESGNLLIRAEIEDLTHIDLSEDRLTDLGFKWSILHQATHKDGFDFDLNSLHDGGYSLSTFKRGYIIAEKIETIHRLQNIYFDLTEKQLSNE